MGDGQHAWAAAEWVIMMRNLFVREEGDTLILGAGLPFEWLDEKGKTVAFGPTPTPHGPVSLEVTGGGDGSITVSWKAEWRGEPPQVTVALPGFERIDCPGDRGEVILENATGREGGARR